MLSRKTEESENVPNVPIKTPATARNAHSSTLMRQNTKTTPLTLTRKGLRDVTNSTVKLADSPVKTITTAITKRPSKLKTSGPKVPARPRTPQKPST